MPIADRGRGTRRGRERVRGWLLSCAAALAAALPVLPAYASHVQPAPEISLLTFAPGEIYWQRFGHNAVLVRDRSRGEALVYNYGIFDFRQKNFFLNFARGRMLYRLDVAPLDWTLRQYATEGRWAVEQQLALGPARRREIADFLAWNARPENAEYRYDYFTSNCSTKTRDVIDRGLDGGLRRALESRPGSLSYRGEVLRLMAPMPALMLGMDLGLGPRADAPLNQWQEGFIPMRLMAAIRDVRVDNGAGAEPLVMAERTLIAAPDPGAPARPSSLLGPGVLAGLVLVAVLAGAGRRHRTGAAALPGLVAVLLFALAGTVLVLGWLATDHWGMDGNRNLLLLNPLWWALLPAAWRRCRGATEPSPGRAARVAAFGLAGAALLSLPVALLGDQPNLHWVAALLPAQLWLLFALTRTPRQLR